MAASWIDFQRGVLTEPPAGGNRIRGAPINRVAHCCRKSVAKSPPAQPPCVTLDVHHTASTLMGISRVVWVSAPELVVWDSALRICDFRCAFPTEPREISPLVLCFWRRALTISFVLFS